MRIHIYQITQINRVQDIPRMTMGTMDLITTLWGPFPRAAETLVFRFIGPPQSLERENRENCEEKPGACRRLFFTWGIVTFFLQPPQEFLTAQPIFTFYLGR